MAQAPLKISQSSQGWQKQRTHPHEGHPGTLILQGQEKVPVCTELTSTRSAACPFFPMAVSHSQWMGHSMAPDVDLVCMTVLLRAVPTRSNAKHADKGKGSDLEMTK